MVKLGIERQLGHTDDAVHRSADLVTHVGQELHPLADWLPRRQAGPPEGLLRAVAHQDFRRQLCRWFLHAFRLDLVHELLAFETKMGKAAYGVITQSRTPKNQYV